MPTNTLTGKAKFAIMIAGVAVVALSWAGVVVAVTVFDAGRETKLILVFGAAVLTEIVLWIGGALLGIAEFQKVHDAIWMRAAKS